MEKKNKNKRYHCELSPGEADQQDIKKYLPSSDQNQSSDKMGDTFSWEIFDRKMEKMMENVAKKEDIFLLNEEIAKLKSENNQLQRELGAIKNKLQFFDQRSRCNNIIVCGLKANSNLEAKQTMLDLCAKVLKTNAIIVRCIEIKPKSEYLFELDSASQVCNILYNSGKLRGSGIFVQRDYTETERNQRFNLRQVKRGIQKSHKDVSCRFKDTILYVNNRPFKWYDSSIIVNTEEDKRFLVKLLGKDIDKYAIKLCKPRSDKHKLSSTANQQ